MVRDRRLRLAYRALEVTGAGGSVGGVGDQREQTKADGVCEGLESERVLLGFGLAERRASTSGQHSRRQPWRGLFTSTSLRVSRSVDTLHPVHSYQGGSRCPGSSSPSTCRTSTRPSTSTPSCSPPAGQAPPGYANFAVAEPPLKLVLIENPGAAARSTTSASRSSPPTRSPRPRPASPATGSPPRRGQRHLLLRRAGQGVGRRPRRCAVGDLHGARRQRDPRRRAAHRRRLRRRAPAPPPTSRRRAPRPSPAAAERDAVPRPRATAEAVGTGLLVAAVVGSGIAAERLSPDDVGLQLLENARHRRGARRAHPGVRAGVGRPLQPGRHPRRPGLGGIDHPRAAAYIAAQIVGACARRDHREPDVRPARRRPCPPTTARQAALWLGEVVATFGLLLVILGVVRSGGRQRARSRSPATSRPRTGSRPRRASPTRP